VTWLNRERLSIVFDVIHKFEMPTRMHVHRAASVDWRKFEVRYAGSTSGTYIGQLVEDPVINDVGKCARSRAHG
jgi:hypothetical protein